MRPPIFTTARASQKDAIPPNMRKKISHLIASLLCLLGVETALPGAPEPTRLHEIGVNRFVERAPGEVWLQRGLLTTLGAFRVVDESPVLSTVVVPAAARNRTLIILESWFAYERLGPEALVGFVADEDSPPYTIGLRLYMPVAAHPNAPLDRGNITNLSTRGRASATDKLIGGFVVDEQHRRVLVRAVGPGLAPHGVTEPMLDPYLTIYQGNTPIYFNGDWHTRPDAGEIAQAGASVGAFPLGQGSKDAALLVELAPGTYTVHVEPETGGAGTALLEIYRVP